MGCASLIDLARRATTPFLRRCLLVSLGAAIGMGAATVATPAADRSSRELLVAHDAMRDERIDTSERGQVQLLFGDQSSLSIAPGSEVVINEFLYDPQTQTGNLTATVTSGLLRYVGGDISRKKDIAFHTPGAMVSVRGGIVLIKAGRDARVGRSGGMPSPVKAAMRHPHRYRSRRRRSRLCSAACSRPMRRSDPGRRPAGAPDRGRDYPPDRSEVEQTPIVDRRGACYH